MLRIRELDIYHTRGDTDSIAISPKNADGSDIKEFSAVFSVKRSYSDKSPLFQLELKNGAINFTHEVTRKLPPGDYVWDIELRLSNGTYQTIGPGVYHLKPDVTV